MQGIIVLARIEIAPGHDGLVIVQAVYAEPVTVMQDYFETTVPGQFHAQRIGNAQ